MNGDDLSDYEALRYDRHIKLLGVEGQRKLRGLRVFVAGAGGLGTFVAVHLAALGVGRIYVVDRDLVSVTDLNRQILYTPLDVGKPKAEVICRRLKDFNPFIEVHCLSEELSDEVLDDVLSGVDVVIDALDNWRSRHLLNRYAVEYGKPLIHGGVRGFFGEVMTVVPGETPCLHCLYPREDDQREIPVISPVVSIVASIQVLELLKLVLNIGASLRGRLLLFDGLKMRFDVIEIQRNPQCPVCSSVRRLRNVSTG